MKLINVKSKFISNMDGERVFNCIVFLLCTFSVLLSLSIIMKLSSFIQAVLLSVSLICIALVLIIIGILALLILKPFSKKMDEIGKSSDKKVSSLFQKK